MLNFVNKGSDYELLKSLNKQGLVQKDVQVQGKHGTFTRKQWVSPFEQYQVVKQQPVKKDKSKKPIKKQYFPIVDCGKSTIRKFSIGDITQYYAQHRIKQPLQKFIQDNYFISDGENRTVDLYKKDGKYIKSRQKLHDKIVRTIVNSANSPKNGEKPLCILMGGGSASGKGTFRNTMILPKLKSMGLRMGIADPDDIKEQIPEYEYFKEQNIQTAAARVHRESSDINQEAINALIENRKNFMWDGTMSDARLYNPVIEHLKKAGYRTYIIGTDVSIELALQRSHERAKITGRDVPDYIVASAHGGFANTYPQLINKVDGYFLYDTSEKNNPILIEDSKGINRVDLKQRFNKKAQDFMDTKRVDQISKSEVFDLLNH